MKKVRFAAVLFLWSASAGFGQVRTWVSPTGLDSNPCTREQPCRNFAAAITAVAAGGEVVALESAGYGPVTITKSVTVVAPAGVHAAIAPSSGTAITLNAADTDQIMLRNLYLNAQGAETGIDAVTVAALHVESCVVSGFNFGGGIQFSPTSSGSRLHVSDTNVRGSSGGGIVVIGGTGIRATIHSVLLTGTGVYVENAEATIRESVASGGLDAGFFAALGSRVMIENSASTDQGYGFRAESGSVMTMTRCAATYSSVSGVLALGDGSTIYVSDSTIAANATGITVISSGVVTSRGNNTLQANTANGAFNGTFNPD